MTLRTISSRPVANEFRVERSQEGYFLKEEKRKTSVVSGTLTGNLYKFSESKAFFL